MNELPYKNPSFGSLCFSHQLMMNEKFVAALAWMPLRPLKWLVSKVLITSWFNDKILEHHFLVHEGCVIMMFYVPQEPKSGHPKFYH